MDASGNALVTGFFRGPATFGDFTFGGGGTDVFIAKYATSLGPDPIPSIGQWGLAILFLLLVIMGVGVMKNILFLKV